VDHHLVPAATGQDDPLPGDGELPAVEVQIGPLQPEQLATAGPRERRDTRARADNFGGTSKPLIIGQQPVSDMPADFLAALDRPDRFGHRLMYVLIAV
jgi:hypothetical protein